MKNQPGGDAETLIELAREKGLKGLRESEMRILLPLDQAEMSALAQKLEGEGKLRILSFFPLFLVSPESVEFLGRKILPTISQFHQKNPGHNGVALDRLKRRFDVPAKILALALKTLVHEGRLKQDGRLFALAGFEHQLPPREEQLLREIEEVCFGGDFHVVSLKDILGKFRLSPQKLQSLLDVLIKRNRIVPGKEDLFLHSRWRDEIVGKIRGLGKKELTIADFKVLTGLSRKFSIPLLELLDEWGVTRREGSIREIL